jgi:hypothetical protein
MFQSIYDLLQNAIFGVTIPPNLATYADQFLVNMSALITTSITLLPFFLVIGMISFLVRTLWR